MSELEMCTTCDEPTGNAGKGEDSLYRDDGSGPYCDSCFEPREQEGQGWFIGEWITNEYSSNPMRQLFLDGKWIANIDVDKADEILSALQSPKGITINHELHSELLRACSSVGWEELYSKLCQAALGDPEQPKVENPSTT